MKANEMPEKIYIFDYNDAMVTPLEGDTVYVREDAFIEKAVKWIEEINNYHHIMRYSDSCEPPLSELTEWFKNYMKGE